MLTPDAAVSTNPAAPDAAPLGSGVVASPPTAPVNPTAAAAAVLANHQAQVDAGDFDEEDGTRRLADGSVQVLTNGAYKRIKDAALKKGERAAQVALEDRARAAGFASVDAMFAMLPQLQQSNRAGTTAAPPAATPSQGAVNADAEIDTDATGKKLNYREQRKYELQVKRLKEEREEAKEARLKAERRLRQIESERETAAAEAQIRMAVTRQGASDVDYVAALYLKEARAEKFDEGKFFTDLRASRPYLFGEARQPVSTGTDGGAPPAPSPGVVSSQQAQSGRVDARKMSPEEWRAYNQKRGINLAGGAG